MVSILKNNGFNITSVLYFCKTVFMDLFYRWSKHFNDWKTVFLFEFWMKDIIIFLKKLKVCVSTENYFNSKII